MNSASILGASQAIEVSEPVRDAMAHAHMEMQRAFGLLEEVEGRLSRHLSGAAPSNASGKSVKEAPRCEAHEQAIVVAETATSMCDRLIQLRERIVT